MKKIRSFMAVFVSMALALCLTPGWALAANTQTAAAGELATQATSETQTDAQWTSADFTYDYYEKLLYGCDYSRQFTVSGKAVTGFSEEGEEKLASCTDLVIPAKDDDGNTIVAVAPNAFYNKGLTSVTFPTGMMVPYDDQLTERVTKRGNFIIGESAFGKNKLTELYLPSGVLAVMSGAFQSNQLTSVTLPQTIWWIETASFAKNALEHVNFPATTDFHLEMHGMAFARNQIKSVRLPDYTEVVNKDTFAMNPGMEESPDSYEDKAEIIASGYPCGVVYMYTDSIGLAKKDRIHHIERTTASTKSYTQKLVVNDGTAETQNPDTNVWTAADFTFDGTTVTGLSESGVAKRATNTRLTIPTYTPDWDEVTAIASTDSLFGLFATEDEGFDSVELPEALKSIGDRAFVSNGLKDITWSPKVSSVGLAAFQGNNLSSVILPDTVTDLGEGAFASNQLIERVDISKGLTEIPGGAFGCSDADHWMKNWMNVDIPEGITSIGDNAFAGNNFERIVIPSTVTKIGRFAFSTKNYLKTPCKLTLNEGLKTIGKWAFRNKIIAKVTLPSTVEALPDNTFLKAYSASIEDTIPMITKVIATTEEQRTNKELFPSPCEDSHIILSESEVTWVAEDFTYGEFDTTYEDLKVVGAGSDKIVTKVNVITGLTGQGEERLTVNTDLVIPDTDPDGNAICGVGSFAFQNMGITSVTFPEAVMCENEMTSWNPDLTHRGNFFIGASAFMGNELTELTLPEGVLAVYGNAFKSNKITSVSFPNTLFYIGNQSFAKNAIEQVSFAAQTDYPLQIASMSFGINNIRAVQLPDNIGYVQKWAFFQNTGIEPVVSDNENETKGGVVYMYVTDLSLVSDNVADVTAGTSNVQKLVEGTLPTDDAYTESDFTYKGSTVTGWTESGKIKRLTNHNLVIPSKTPEGITITAIGDSAFRSPDDEVADAAKYDYQVANGIKTVEFPSTIKSIGKDAFLYNSLSAVDFPDTLQSIGETAFKANHLLRVTLPDSVTKLGEGAFAANSIVELTLSKSLTTIPAGAFSMNIRMDHVDLHEGIVEIGDTAFAGARLESLKIPSTVTKIGRKAFHLHRMTSLVVPGNVKELGDNAFEGTYKGQTLKSLTLEEGIESIGEGAFKEGLLETVTLPKSLKTMGKEPFENNTGKNKSQVVELKSMNKDQLSFNSGAKWHKVVLDPSAKVKQPLKAKAKKKVVTLKVKKLKKKAISVSNIKITKKGKGTVTYSNVSKNKKAKKFKVTKKGVVKVTKKLKKGTYPVRVKIKASGTELYKAGSVTVTFKVKVK